MNPQILTYLIIKYPQPIDELQLRNLIHDLRQCGNSNKQIDIIISEHFKVKQS
jgi:hypothetical protein